MSAVLLATLLIASVTARRNAGASIARGLATTTERVQDLMGTRERELRGKLAIFVEPGERRGLMQRDSAGGEDFLDQVQEAATSTGADWVQATNGEGILLARSDVVSAGPVDLSGSALVSGALLGHPTSGFGVAADTALFQAVAVPLLRALSDSTTAFGAMMGVRYLDTSFVAELGAATGSEIALFILPIDSTQPPRIIAASAALRDRPALARVVADWRRARAMLPLEMGDGAQVVLSPEERSARPPDPAHLAIDGTDYVGQGRYFLSASGQEVGGFVALRSLDAELALFRRFRNIMLAAGLGGLLLVFALSGWLAGRIARPVQVLVAATRRASEGDYAAELPASRGDEIGQLADAVRRLLADLLEKQQLVDYLGGGSGGRSLRFDGVGATMPMAMAGAALEVGSLLGDRYRITQVLGAGGMGMVYKALDQALGEPVAVKTLRPDFLQTDPTAVDRFKSEIRLARKISHRNVVRTHDLGEAEGMLFITMELVEGRTLKDLIHSRGRLPAQAVLPIAKQLCRALEVAHEAGVIHRDIKPQNLVVEPDGVLKVMDFGIARLTSGTSGMTQAGMVVGTPEYMAPEQLLGDDVDPRVDIYAAGAVLYECLTGRVPFPAESAITLIAKVLEEVPPSPAELVPGVPRALASLVLRCLAKDRDDRPRSAGELHDLLERAGEGAVAGGELPANGRLDPAGALG
ncbi:MAG TPA: protein kinase [Gemmatimonadaceae bacterium]